MEKIPDITPDVRIDAANFPPYDNSTLPPAIRSRIVNNINSLAMHVLEAGFETKGTSLHPCFCIDSRSLPTVGAK